MVSEVSSPALAAGMPASQVNCNLLASLAEQFLDRQVIVLTCSYGVHSRMIRRFSAAASAATRKLVAHFLLAEHLRPVRPSICRCRSVAAAGTSRMNSRSTGTLSGASKSIGSFIRTKGTGGFVQALDAAMRNGDAMAEGSGTELLASRTGFRSSRASRSPVGGKGTPKPYASRSYQPAPIPK